MTKAADNYYNSYHKLVLTRIMSGQTKLYPHQVEALFNIFKKASEGMDDSSSVLYPHQLETWLTTYQKGSQRQAAWILAGAGAGKTLMQVLVPYILAPQMQGKQALMLFDNCTLRSRFVKNFPTDTNNLSLYEEWLLYSLKILPPDVPPPQIVELDATDFNSYVYTIQQADMLVVTRQSLMSLVQQGDIAPESVGLIITDEAHFSDSGSYSTIFNYFNSALLVYFTSFKFRSDSQPLPFVRYIEVEDRDEFGNCTIRYAPWADFEFTVRDAWKLNPSPIKKLIYKEVTSSAFKVEEEGLEVEYDLEQFLLKAQTDRQWFRQILLADSFSLPVLEMAVSILLSKQSATGQPHAMLVRSLNIPHVHRVAKLLEDHFPILKGKVLAIDSEHEQYDLAGRASTLLERFYEGEYWVVVHCGMLGVGFEHKWVSVSCCLCILKSMSAAEQEWGRALRKVPGPSPGQVPELNHSNWAVVVTHSALGVRELFEKFQQGKTSSSSITLPPSDSPPAAGTGVRQPGPRPDQPNAAEAKAEEDGTASSIVP